ncbi:ATP-dependent DNA helicase RecG [Bifidobacterium sp. B4107]|uniref:ATP-dependent DNA helicase RecG n=1 Tax=unclassified Bifidobacterium TaxID=2608897 RepID=UPI00226B2FDC|nr:MULTISPECIES: ATP-dependent DNA helicase RecG [unclassified Bifidobacterium]MCX8647710.1 ATP-dependent DNA helicase RecG [Bifidobacterium sp. B4107]MCX8651890.1 ATP-dependent DNA helicase RecG [Bifidobacterium sp. B4111]MCX8658474.1 ATP-dependent DNA helicase RecG [Bifidobacterium sp. B4114]
MSAVARVGLHSTVASLVANRRRVSALKALGVVTVRDALTYYPFRITDPMQVTTIAGIRLGEPCAFAARVDQVRLVPLSGHRGFRLDVMVDDAAFVNSQGGTPLAVRLVFFSHKKPYMDWMVRRLQVGADLVVAGEPGIYMDQLQFTHPETLVVADADREVLADASRPDVASLDEALERVRRPRPVYHASSRISSDHIHDVILGFLRLLAQADGVEEGQPSAEVRIDPEALGRAIPDVLPEQVRVDQRLMHRARALLGMHAPESPEDFAAARKTLRYEEAFVSQTALLQTRRQTQQQPTYPCANSGADRPDTLPARFIDSLPFQLTDGQRQVINDIGVDMAQDQPMQRLLQGEVGSGKTVVALAAMLQAVQAGHQAVLVAPTQVLAEQHYASIGGMLKAMGADVTATAVEGRHKPVDNVTMIRMTDQLVLPLVLLTGGMRLAQRRSALAVSASGRPCIVIATHAAFSKTFQAPNLALTVIDEQHRFGVEQREELRRKSDRVPHLLIMTATPIPRTAAMTWFGDLDISALTELPSNRKPVRTHVIAESDGATMGAMFLHLRRRIEAGERAYVICARIDDEDDPSVSSDRSGQSSAPDSQPELLVEEGQGDGQRPPLHSVAEMSQRLAALPQFQGIAMATLTGRDDDVTKNAVMADFASGRTPLLVATTVVEVGVDVPQASCIVIFDADRFGLSQLHQLRGRVGRGGTDSWAFLVSRAPADSPAAERLEVIRDTTDGAKIAEEDIRIRGAGDVLGDAQSGGHSSLKLLRVVTDAPMIARARTQAGQLLESDPTLAGQPELAGAVLDFMRGNEGFLVSS